MFNLDSVHALVAWLRGHSDLANVLAAVASAGAALFALLVSIVSATISVWSVRAAREQHQLSVRPLAEITVADYEDCLRVKLRNHGLGPMIITAISVSDGQRALPSLLEWMPQLPNGRSWSNFISHDVRGRVVPAGSELVLVELTALSDDSDFGPTRDSVRSALARLTVDVAYTDLYKADMPSCSKSLSWFGRH